MELRSIVKEPTVQLKNLLLTLVVVAAVISQPESFPSKCGNGPSITSDLLAIGWLVRRHCRKSKGCFGRVLG